MMYLCEKCGLPKKRKRNKICQKCWLSKNFKINPKLTKMEIDDLLIRAEQMIYKLETLQKSNVLLRDMNDIITLYQDIFDKELDLDEATPDEKIKYMWQNIKKFKINY